MYLSQWLKNGIGSGLVLISCSVSAMTQIPVPTDPIYFEPPVVAVPDAVRKQSCVTIDNAIRYLKPYEYSYKPNFYQDGFNKFATGLVAFDVVPVFKGWLGLGFLGYSALTDEKEQRRMILVQQKIFMLQRVKAEKHCFE